MSSSPQQPSVEQLKSTVNSLVVLNRLMLEALLRESQREVEFHILNRSVSFIHYDRSMLVELPSKKVLGLSGTDQPDKQSPLFKQLSDLLLNLNDLTGIRKLSAEDFSDPTVWEQYCKLVPSPSVIWVALGEHADKETCWGLWLERWEGRDWDAEEIKAVKPLTTAYTQILKRWSGAGSRKGKALGGLLKFWPICAIFVAILLTVPLRLRIVAPCEIVAIDPVIVAARTDGVVKRVLVDPGEEVKAGQDLVEFEKDVAVEEYKAALQQVRINESDLKRAEVKSLQDLSERESLQLLANRLQQEKARLQIASKRLKWLELHAPVSGTVLMSDPHRWQGRPVQTGESIMLLVDPHKNKVRIYLPPDDRLDFKTGTQVRVFLDSDSGLSREATLQYLSQFASLSPSQKPAFTADATWDKPQQGVLGGMQGTAIVYGRKVSLFYWLLRKPIGSIRRYFGI